MKIFVLLKNYSSTKRHTFTKATDEDNLPYWHKLIKQQLWFFPEDDDRDDDDRCQLTRTTRRTGSLWSCFGCIGRSSGESERKQQEQACLVDSQLKLQLHWHIGNVQVDCM